MSLLIVLQEETKDKGKVDWFDFYQTRTRVENFGGRNELCKWSIEKCKYILVVFTIQPSFNQPIITNLKLPVMIMVKLNGIHAKLHPSTSFHFAHKY
jgi:hypothetical protein